MDINNAVLKILTEISWKERWEVIRSQKVFDAITMRIHGIRGILRQENHCLVFYVNDIIHTINVHSRFCGVSFEVRKLDEFIPQTDKEQSILDLIIKEKENFIRLFAMDSIDSLFRLNIIIEELLNA